VRTRKLTIDSRTERLIAVREFVSGAARDFGFDEEDIGKISLAVDEACTNVIKHAYGFDGSKSLTVTVVPGNNYLEILITDTGKRFDPDKIDTPDMQEYLAHYRKGGLGVYLMKKLMDEVEYHLLPGERNEVRLVKYLGR
jgi:serine/threonine-protein kinase RsbW